MKSYSIYSEGYIVQGNSSGYMYQGSASGENFKEACINFAKENEQFYKYFNEELLTYWGCRLFDNAEDASKNYG